MNIARKAVNWAAEARGLRIDGLEYAPMKVCSEEDIVVDVVELDVVGQNFENGRGRSRATKLNSWQGSSFQPITRHPTWFKHWNHRLWWDLRLGIMDYSRRLMKSFTGWFCTCLSIPSRWPIWIHMCLISRSLSKSIRTRSCMSLVNKDVLCASHWQSRW